MICSCKTLHYNNLEDCLDCVPFYYRIGRKDRASNTPQELFDLDLVCSQQLTRCIIPAAVNQTPMKIETSWASLIELDVFKILRYWRISGTVIKRNARRNRRPKKKKVYLIHEGFWIYPIRRKKNAKNYAKIYLSKRIFIVWTTVAAYHLSPISLPIEI